MAAARHPKCLEVRKSFSKFGEKNWKQAKLFGLNRGEVRIINTKILGKVLGIRRLLPRGSEKFFKVSRGVRSDPKIFRKYLQTPKSLKNLRQILGSRKLRKGSALENLRINRGKQPKTQCLEVSQTSSEKNSHELPQVLLVHGANVDNRNWNGTTTFHRKNSRFIFFFFVFFGRATGWSKKESVRFLVDRGANVNIQDSIGDTPLHIW